MKQKICDEWLENSITTVDRRNGRDCTKIRKSVYLELFKDLVNEDVIKEETSKIEIKLLTATKKVMTCSIRKLQTKLFEKYNISASLGTIYNLKPFYISFPTEKEKNLCMCKVCLNIGEKFDCLMDGSKKHNGKIFKSISSLFMKNCTYDQSELGYCSFDCCNGLCNSFENRPLPEIPNLTDHSVLSNQSC